MPTLPNMGLITPTAGADSGTWDDKINACFALVDAHDHTSGKGVQVPVAGIDIDDDFAMGGNGLTGVGLVAFNAVTTLASGSKSLFVSEDDNELYWRTNAGTNVKLTSGTALNVAAFVGGIAGDYSSVGAEVAFSDADQVYTFKDQSSPTKKWARLASGPVRIYENDTTESVYVEHATAAALASSYTVTWPAALPGTATAVQISTGGVVSFSNTFANALTATEFKHTTAQTMTLSLVNAQDVASAHSLTAGWAQLGASTGALYVNVPINVGQRVTLIRCHVEKNSDATNTLTAILYKVDPNGPALTAVATATSNAAAPGALTFNSGAVSIDIELGYSYFVSINQSDSTPSAIDYICGIDIVYTRP